MVHVVHQAEGAQGGDLRVARGFGARAAFGGSFFGGGNSWWRKRGGFGWERGEGVGEKGGEEYSSDEFSSEARKVMASCL